MKRLVLVAALAVATAAPTALAAASKCPEFWYERPTGLTNPVTQRPITYCWPMS